MSDIYAALSAVMADVQAVKKGEVNRQGGYSFRGIDAVVNAVGPALRKHKVIVVPDVRTYTHGEIAVGKNRTPMGHARVIVAYHFHAEDGSSITCSAAAESFDSGDKATAKAMSVAYRTALLQALCLPTDEPDPDSHTYERSDAPPSRDQAKARAWAATGKHGGTTEERMAVLVDALHGTPADEASVEALINAAQELEK